MTKRSADSICYKRNFLRQVIARLDFAAEETSFNKRVPQGLLSAVLPTFPINEPRRFIARNLQIGPDKVVQNESEGVEWVYHDKHRTKSFSLTPSSLHVSYTKYESFDQLLEDFLPAVDALYAAAPGIQVNRLGLRYVNVLDLPGPSPYDWVTYIHSSFLALVAFHPRPSELVRVFHILEINVDDLQLRFQAGMNNPDYPARIRQRSFVLDLDGYYQGLQEREAIPAHIAAAHKAIQELFERSITPNLRRELNA